MEAVGPTTGLTASADLLRIQRQVSLHLRFPAERAVTLSPIPMMIFCRPETSIEKS